MLNINKILIRLRIEVFNAIDNLFLVIFRLFSFLEFNKENQFGNNTPAPKKILIIFINAIGDFVIFSSVLPYLKRLYDDCEITLLCFNRWIELLESCPYIDKVISLNREQFRKNIIYRYQYLYMLQKEIYLKTIYPSYSRMPVGDTIIQFSRSREKIGWDGDLNNISSKEKNIANKYYTQLFSLSKAKQFREIDKYVYYCNKLGAEISDTTLPSLWLSEKDINDANMLLAKNSISNNTPFAVLFPGASSPKRIWNCKSYSKIADFLGKKGLKVIICGTASEHYLYKDIQKNCKVHIVNLTGKTSLNILSVIIKYSKIYIGSETSALHIAIAVKTPTICIMGGGHFKRFYPYGDEKIHRMVYHKMDCFGCNWRCKFKTIRCIDNIKVDDVTREIELVLD